MEMCTFEQYLKEPYALDFQQMQKIHGELLKEPANKKSRLN